MDADTARIRKYFQSRNLPIPDYIFDPFSAVEHESRWPFCSNSAGCYLFFETDDLFPVYAGKAIKLSNRIGNHLRAFSPFLRRWFDEYKNFTNSYVLYAAVWITDERAAFESKLIKHISPCYNLRRE